MKPFPLIFATLIFSATAFGAAPTQWSMEMGASCRRALEQVSAGAFAETNPNEIAKTSTFGSRVLNVTAQAMIEMDHLDRFVRDRDIVAEIGGFGVLKQTGPKEYTMTEFLAPHPERILVIEALFQNQFQSRIPNIILGSHSLILEVDGNTIQIKSDKTELTTTIQASDWNSAHPILERLANRSLPASETDMLTALKSTGPITLNTTWDAIVSGGSVTLSGPFVERARQVAAQKGEAVNFTMHYHPQLGLAYSIYAEKPLAERRKYFEQLVSPSLQDLKSMDKNSFDWFEIRVVGTPEVMGSETKTTSMLYHMTEVRVYSRKLSSSVADILSRHSSGADTSSQLSQVLGDIQQITKINVGPAVALEFSLGAGKFAEMKKWVESQSRYDPTIYALQTLFSSRTNVGEAKALLNQERIQTMIKYRTFQLYSKMIEVSRQKDDTGRGVYQIMDHYKLWSLLSEPDINKIVVASSFLKQTAEALDIHF